MFGFIVKIALTSTDNWDQKGHIHNLSCHMGNHEMYKEEKTVRTSNRDEKKWEKDHETNVQTI